MRHFVGTCDLLGPSCLYHLLVSGFCGYLDDWLTVLHRSITLADLQLDAQNSYLFTYNTFINP